MAININVAKESGSMHVKNGILLWEFRVWRGEARACRLNEINSATTISVEINSRLLLVKRANFSFVELDAWCFYRCNFQEVGRSSSKRAQFNETCAISHEKSVALVGTMQCSSRLGELIALRKLFPLKLMKSNGVVLCAAKMMIWGSATLVWCLTSHTANLFWRSLLE